MSRRIPSGYLLTEHARVQMARRGLSESLVAEILRGPEQRLPAGPDRAVLQSRMPGAEAGKVYLVRVLVDVGKTPPEVVTAYRTSKVSKYWEDAT